MELSVMFFGADATADHAAAYADILTIARAADELGFSAIWTPERHFQQVGQVFPNPALLAAALTQVTRRISLRAGSVVLPLHHPLRVVEDWAVVDNLSGGRVGLSAATGWHSSDFALAPGHYADRRERTVRDISLIRRLWAGDAVEFTDGLGEPVALRPQPTPYSPNLPLWLTSSGNPETWWTAAELRTGVLGATMGHDRPVLEQRITRYQQLYADAAPQPGTPARGTVTLMAHAFVAASDAEAQSAVRDPLKAYFGAHVRQTASDRSGARSRDLAGLSGSEMDLLAEFALQRYLTWGSLIGSAETCRKSLADLADMGCDEVACFVDFGLGRDEILSSLTRLAELRNEMTS